MLNVIWGVSVILSSVFILIKNPASFVMLFSDSAESAVSLILSLTGIMALWGGIMEIVERSGITEWFAKLLSPVINILFPKIKNDTQCKRAIAMNMTANVLGLGNAATPLGLEAMKRLSKKSGNPDTATDTMITFVLVNTASIQLIPATTAVLRSEYGSKNPMSILPAVLAASVCSLIVGLIADRLLRGRSNA